MIGKRTFGTLAITLFIFAAAPDALGQYVNQHCRCGDITPAQLWRADAWLWLSRADRQASLDTHLPWGVPENPGHAENERLLIQRHYVLNHDGDLRTSTWAAYRLRKRDLARHRERTECFRQDTRLSTSQAGYCADYKEPTYDQGHLVPNSDMKRSLTAMLNTYMMSNMAPQHCAFNRGTWLILEELVRHWAEEKKTIYVITGAVFDRDGQPGRDPDDGALRMQSDNGKTRVAVPSHFYKILLHKPRNQPLQALGILLPHVPDKIPSGRDAQREYLKGHIVSIDDIEKVTGINFLRELEGTDPDTTRTIESEKAHGLWPEPSAWPRRLDSRC